MKGKYDATVSSNSTHKITKMHIVPVKSLDKTEWGSVSKHLTFTIRV